MMTTETAGRIEDLEEAQELLEQAIAMIRAATQASSEERRAEAYILPHLEGWISDSRQSSYCSIADLKKSLIEEDEQDEDDPEDDEPVGPEPTIDEVMENVERQAATSGKEELIHPAKTYRAGGDPDGEENHLYAEAVRQNKVGDILVAWIAAPGSGQVHHRITRIDDTGVYGVERTAK